MVFRPRVFLDTSVLLAGLASPQGASHVILCLAEEKLIVPVISEEVLVEAERNLQEKLPLALPEYRHFLAVCPLEIVPAPFAWQIKVAGAIIHPKDAPILAAAMSARIDYLVTHNRKHFLDDPEVPRRSGLTIGTPGDFLAWFREQLAT